MDYHHYFTTTADARDLLESWRWLIGEELQLWRVSKSGDVFLKHRTTGVIHFLDTLDGTVHRFAESVQDVGSKLRDEESVDRWLLAGLVDAAAARGMNPGPEQCLSFMEPPQLGGPVSVDNMSVCSLIVSLSLTGQLRRQIKDMPAGTRISEFRLIDERGENRAAKSAPPKTPWWKRCFGAR